MLNNQEISVPVLIEDLGMKFPTENSKEKVRFGIYKCSCGVEFTARSSRIKHGYTKSCGCLSVKIHFSIHGKHGFCNHPLYSTWKNIISRCGDKKRDDYKYYGGRGVTVCERWVDIKNFIEDMYPTYKKGLTIDRKDTNGNYEPSNCRWTTKTVQSRNTRKIRSNNKSGYRGVSFCSIKNKWVCGIRIGAKRKYLGYFDTAIEAAKAYDKYVIQNNLEHTINGVL